ncbi:DoxX family protein [Nonomuraea sp. NPDC046802]|uniref:DoxX family protein n=1 Tax=Nonomuraea sp. NPDC046802 TaxID=3154919 RepID=UPI0033C5155C
MTEKQAATASAARHLALNIALWVLQAFLAFTFLSAGYTKLSGDPLQVELFANVGVGQWLRHLTGVLEIAGAIGVLIPPLSGLAACGLAGIMVSAIVITVLVVPGDLWAPSGFLVLSLLVVLGRWSRTKALIGTFRR